MDKKQQLKNYKPGDPGVSNGQIFGLPFTLDTADLILLPVPWDVTSSYGTGSSQGPAAILEASPQLDLFDPMYPHQWEQGIHMSPVSEDWSNKNKHFRKFSQEVISMLEQEEPIDNAILQSALNEVNKASEELNSWVQLNAKTLLDLGKKVAIIGGDHSTPLGLMKALGEQNKSFGILQIDAHADLRESYEGFHHSHASIMHNALKISAVDALVQVFVRDMSHEEAIRAHDNPNIHLYHDQSLSKHLLNGTQWAVICDDIISKLPQKVYISFDIDGLNPALCPNTGTPVPGGPDWRQVSYLLDRLGQSGKEIIGFDLCEVAPGSNDWDANVGARVLYKLCQISL